MEKQTEDKRKCKTCGKPLDSQAHKLQRYCSRACYPTSGYVRLAERLKLPQRKCAYPPCGEFFTPTRVKQKYHTAQCVSRHWYAQHGLQSVKRELAALKALLNEKQKQKKSKKSVT